jgi:hypothetical protein
MMLNILLMAIMTGCMQGNNFDLKKMDLPISKESLQFDLQEQGTDVMSDTITGGRTDDYFQHLSVKHMPSVHEISRPGYTPMSIKPLRARGFAWNEHGYAVHLYSVTLEEPGFEGLESYLFNTRLNSRVKIASHKIRGNDLEVPVLQVADMNKDGMDELIYVYSFDTGGYRVVEALVLKDEAADGKLVQIDDLSLALREFQDFNQLSGSSNGKAAPVNIDEIYDAIDAFIQKQ